MPRKPEGPRALTGAERQSRSRQRQAEREQAIADAFARIIAAGTIAEARRIAAAVIAPERVTAPD